jgi:hypothetical protein
MSEITQYGIIENQIQTELNKNQRKLLLKSLLKSEKEIISYLLVELRYTFFDIIKNDEDLSSLFLEHILWSNPHKIEITYQKRQKKYILEIPPNVTEKVIEVEVCK